MMRHGTSPQVTASPKRRTRLSRMRLSPPNTALSESRTAENEEHYFSIDINKIKYEELTIENYSQTIKMRKGFASKNFIIVVAWLIFTAIILLLQGFNIIVLDRGIMIAFLAQTTIQVIGIYIIVLRYLFL